MEYFVVGQVVRLTHSVYNDLGVLTNPSTITLTISLPDGTSSGPLTPTNTDTGLYRYDYTTVAAGPHLYRWDTTGPTAPDDGMFDVRGTSTAVISLADAKAHLNKAAGVTVDDEELRGFVEAATAVIERHTGKVVARRTITERVTASYARELWLAHRPIISVTSITTTDGLTTWGVGPTVISLADGASGVIRWLSGPYWHGDLLVTVVAGMSVIPANYTLAAKYIVEALWSSQRQPGIGPAPATFGGEPEVSVGPVTIPPMALQLLGPSPPMVA